MPRKYPRSNCLVCAKVTAYSGYKYCSNKCQFEYQYRTFIDRWKAGEEKGLSSTGIVKRQIKRYLREKYENKCCVCGWSEVNPKTNTVPLVADHINGNWRDNTEDNLRLVCPNCDSLSPTYAALNKGNGRPNRALSKRTIESRLSF
jgi:hypothetical protein